MRKLFLCLIAFFPMLSYGQGITKDDLNLNDPQTVIFDFTSPNTLTPSVTPSPDGGSSVDVTSTVFSENDVTLGFNKIAGVAAAMAHIFTFHSSLYNKDFYSLRVNSGTQLEFKVNDGILQSIEFVDAVLAGLGVDEGQTGIISQQDMTWYYDENNLSSSLHLSNRAYGSAEMEKIKVNYFLLKALYIPTVDLDQNEIYDSFSSLKLTFDKNVRYDSDKNITINYRGHELKKHSVAVDGNVVTLDLNETVIDDGTVEIIIPAGCFVDEKGYTNKDLTYTYKIVKKRDTFKPVSYYPENNSHVDFLESGQVVITFSGVVSEVDETQRFRLFKEGQSSPICLLKPVRGDGSNTVKLEFVEAVSNVITDNGNYTIIIPEKSFYNYKGDVDYESWNPELTINYALGNIETLVPVVTVVPESESVPEEFRGLNLEFDKTINYVENEGLAIKFNDETVAFSVTVVDKTASIALAEPIAADGLLSIHIPASTFITEDFFANKELDYAYTIKTAVSKKKDEAREMLEQTGVGFPTEESPAYVALKNLVESEAATVDGIDAAIAALYTETVIKLPSNGEFYKISAVNNEGENLYVALNNDNIIITDDINNAAVFETSQDNGRIVFKSMDGKYLPILTASENNLTESITDVNKLQLTKLAIAGKEKATYGLMAMYGQLGENDLGGYNNTYTVFNFESKSLPEATTETPLFDDKFSSAIKLISTDPLDALIKINPIDMDCQRVGNEYKLTINFVESMQVALNQVSTKVKVSFKDSNESEELDLTATGNVSEFVVNLGVKSPGDYLLTIPAKAMKCVVDGKNRLVDEIVVNFKIEDILSANFTVNDKFFYFLETFNTDAPYFCENLNDFGFKINKNDKFNGFFFDSLVDSTTGEKYTLFNDTTMTFYMKDIYLDESKKQRYIDNYVRINNLIQGGGYVQNVDTVDINGYVFRVEPYYRPKGFVPAPEKRVVLRGVHFYQTRYGRFVEHDTGNPDEIAIKIEFEDGPIQPDELRDDDYVFYVERASFGDADFAKYLADQNSVPARRCVVNPRFVVTITVDATLAAAGIKDIGADGKKSKVVYDLMGRKVQDMNRPGIYIINGKKVVVK